MTGALLRARLRSALGRIRHARFALLEALLVGGGLAAGAAWQGHALALDLLAGAGGPQAAWPVLREWVYLGVAIQALVVGYGAMEALLRPPDGPLLLTLPVGPAPRYTAAALDAALRFLPVPLVLTAFVAPLAVLGQGVALARSLALIGAGYAIAVACGLGVSALAGRAAASPHGRAFKELVAGGWVAPDRAPFLYAPAAAGGLAAVLAVPLQVSLDEWPADPTAALVGALIILLAALGVLAGGALAYARGFPRLAPTLEGLDARYPLSPGAGTEGGVYGSALVGRLMGTAGAIARRDLRSVRRRHRSEPVLLAALASAVALVLVRAEASPRAFEVAALALGLFAARTGVRLGEPDVEVCWLSLALPVPTLPLLAAKASVALFHAGHAALPFAAIAWAAGRGTAAVLAVGTAALGSAFGPSLALAARGRATLARGLYLPLAAGLCLVGTAAPALALAALLALAVGTALAARRSQRRGSA